MNIHHHVIPNPVMSRPAWKRAIAKGTLVPLHTPVTLADGSMHGFLSPRTAIFFAREIAKAPGDAVILVDLHETETKAFEAGLTKSPRARAGRISHLHADAACAASGFCRVALLHVNMPMPKEYEERLQLLYTPAEIVKVFAATCHHRFLTILNNRQQAPKGGRARAHYTDVQIEQAFVEYRKRNPAGSLWNACTWLTKPGHALDKYKRDPVRTLLRHVKKLVERSDGFFPDANAWFTFLKPHQ